MGERARKSASDGQREEVIAAVRAFAALDSDLGRRFARRHGMYPTDAAAIVEILNAEQRGETLTPARLAERIGLTAGATSTLLRRLESAGHVIRTHDRDDRRLVSLQSTDSVHEAAATFFTPTSTALHEVLLGYTAAELETVTAVLSGLAAAVASSAETPQRAEK
jgi:DNA-binding MarR family transcriptional regulator